jgi:hypothetical protein
MTFLFTFVAVLATAATLALASMRRFFLTSDAGAYVFVAINWSLLLVAAAAFALFIQLIQQLYVG